MSDVLSDMRDELVNNCVLAMGYRLEPARLERIGVAFDQYRTLGIPAERAFSDAFHEELLIYGDPAAPSVEIRGILANNYPD